VLGDSGDTVNISDFVKAAGITKTEGGTVACAGLF
jgi:hypothetical protein